MVFYFLHNYKLFILIDSKNISFGLITNEKKRNKLLTNR